MSHHYESVLEFNTVFESKVLDKLSKDDSSDSISKRDQLIKFRISLITEEVKELQDAIKDKDVIEVIDALIDILYVAHGALSTFNNRPDFNDIDLNCNNDIRTNLGVLLSKELVVYTNKVFDDLYTNEELKTTQSILITLVDMLSDNSIDSRSVFNEHYNEKFVGFYTNYIITEAFRLEIASSRNIIEISNVISSTTTILQSTYTTLVAFGVDINKAFNIVHSSNMSKLCPTEDKAIQTVNWYKESEKYKSVYDSPAYRKSSGGEFYMVYNESTGKVLKNIDYTPADFSPLFDKVEDNVATLNMNDIKQSIEEITVSIDELRDELKNEISEIRN